MATLQVATVVDVLRAQAGARPERIAFKFEGRTTSYSALLRHAGRVSSGLRDLGVRAGDRVAYVGKNTDFYFEAWIGAMLIGAVMAPINWRLAPPEIEQTLSDSGAKVIFVGRELIEIVRGLQLNGAAVVAEAGEVWPVFHAWRDQQAEAAFDHCAQASDVILQLYTSGTTGRPKGVMSTHANCVRHLDNMFSAEGTWNRWSDDDVGLLSMPVSHIAGSGWGMWTIFHGACAVIERQFDVEATFDAIEREGPTHLFLVPAAMQLLVRHPGARQVDYRSIKNISYGASPIAPTLLRECMAVFGCGFTQMYGMTETFGTVVVLPPEDHLPERAAKLAAAGKAVAGVEIAIVDPAGERLAHGEVGEVVIRSVANMAGYWRMPEATAQTINPDGWLHSGDAGFLDADGYLFIHDRIKDMIVSGAENIYPTEVENVISEHPDVAEVAVIGVPDERWGEAVMAFVVLRPGRTLGDVALSTWLRGRIAAFKTPKSIGFLQALPRNASGKLLKRELRDRFWAGRDRQVA